MKTVWKFELKVTDLQDVDIPAGAELLCVQTQNDTPCLWARVDSDKPKERRRLVTAGTGHNLHSDAGSYIGTYQLHGGALVFHVFTSREP